MSPPRSRAAALLGANFRTVSGPAKNTVSASEILSAAVLPVPPAPMMARQKFLNGSTVGSAEVADNVPSASHTAVMCCCSQAAFHRKARACLTLTLPTSGIFSSPWSRRKNAASMTTEVEAGR